MSKEIVIGQAPQGTIILTMPALMANTQAVQVTDPKTNQAVDAFEVTLKLVVSQPDYHVLTGCLTGTKLTVQVQGKLESGQ